MSEPALLRLPTELIDKIALFLRGIADPTEMRHLLNFALTCKYTQGSAQRVRCSQIGVFFGRIPQTGFIRRPYTVYFHIAGSLMAIFQQNLRILDIPAMNRYRKPAVLTAAWVRSQYVMLGEAIRPLYNLKYLAVSPGIKTGTTMANMVTMDVLRNTTYKLYHLEWMAQQVDLPILLNEIIPVQNSLRSLFIKWLDRVPTPTPPTSAHPAQTFSHIDSITGRLSDVANILPFLPSLQCLILQRSTQQFDFAAHLPEIEHSLRSVQYLDIAVLSHDEIDAILPICVALRVLVIRTNRVESLSQQMRSFSYLVILIIACHRNMEEDAIIEGAVELINNSESLLYVEYSHNSFRPWGIRCILNPNNGTVTHMRIWPGTDDQRNAFRHGYLNIAKQKNLNATFPSMYRRPGWWGIRDEYTMRPCHLWVDAKDVVD